jgi:hypothetical protein
MFGLSMLLAVILVVLIVSDSMETPIIATIVLVPAAAIFVVVLEVRRRRAAWERWKRQRRSGTEERTRRNTGTANEQPHPWWQVLEISERSTLEDVKAAYRAKIKQYHPDKVMGLATELQELADHRSKEINRAYRQACRNLRTKSPP